MEIEKKKKKRPAANAQGCMQGLVRLPASQAKVTGDGSHEARRTSCICDSQTNQASRLELGAAEDACRRSAQPYWDLELGADRI